MCITGQELVDWLIRNDITSTRAQACAIGQALYEGKWLKPVTDIGGVSKFSVCAFCPFCVLSILRAFYRYELVYVKKHSYFCQFLFYTNKFDLTFFVAGVSRWLRIVSTQHKDQLFRIENRDLSRSLRRKKSRDGKQRCDIHLNWSGTILGAGDQMR